MTEPRDSAGTRDDGTPGRPTPGTPCWVSLMAHRPEASQAFYGALFGWEFQPGPQQLGPYVRALLDGHEVAGIGQLPEGRELPIAWTPYLASDDVNVTAETIRHCGGTVGVGPLDAAEAGRMAIASDPAGAVFGVWQAAAHLGAALTGVPGAQAWNELVTRESASVSAFYRAVFGFRTEAEVSADLDYVTLLLDEKPMAAVHGVGNSPSYGQGSRWMTYFAVADVERAVERVGGLGGHLVTPPRDTAHGRIATVADPEGAVFTVIRSERG
ncbi:VOC family protein [Streptomyces tsukubensis]|uniref:Glyoxalase/bleomycin resistance/extradiol dioxygenase family protein n=1 Tax=Streptomyces tsukubensis TaxID=83656 RepID=A0A1V4A3J9_9ACTN|nr:VOC family protein [Streptomyces tsukubensis]OON75111.1 glyoxalase/bleomycin resistance/extradiol dioxygenase family protein [Streptomyces tsukubensis]QFR96139.1 VOC family protein [Streptomyces tsukubensis]